MSVLCQAFGRKTFRIRLDHVKQKAVRVWERTTASVLEEAAEGKDGWIPVGEESLPSAHWAARAILSSDR